MLLTGPVIGTTPALWAHYTWAAWLLFWVQLRWYIRPGMGSSDDGSITAVAVMSASSSAGSRLSPIVPILASRGLPAPACSRRCAQYPSSLWGAVWVHCAGAIRTPWRSADFRQSRHTSQLAVRLLNGPFQLLDLSLHLSFPIPLMRLMSHEAYLWVQRRSCAISAAQLQALHEKWDFHPRKRLEISLIFVSQRQFTACKRCICLCHILTETNHDICGAPGGANGSNLHMNSSETAPGQVMCGLVWMSSLSIGWNRYL